MGNMGTTLVRDPKLDEEDMIRNADFDVKARDFISNWGSDYGIDPSKIGFRKDKNGSMITLGGDDLIAPDRIENGSSYVSNDKIRAALDGYAKQRGLMTTIEKFSPENNGYKDQYTEKINGLLDSILNKQPFQYDPNTDKSFQSYQQQYGRLGDRALANTMSEASSLTGGRLNSWAVSAGQGAKQQYDQQLMDILPRLEQAAYDRYQSGIANDRANLGMLSGLDDKSYNRAIDTRNFGYDVSRDQISDARYNDDKLYDRGRDKLADARYDDDKKYNRGRDTLADTRYDDETKYERGRDTLADTRYEDDKTYSRNQDTINRNDRLAEAAADNSRANAALAIDRERLGLTKEQWDVEKKKIADEAAKAKVDEETLGAAYSAMMQSDDPQKWLAQEAKYMTDDELIALQKLLPKNDGSSILIDAILNGNGKGGKPNK